MVDSAAQIMAILVEMTRRRGSTVNFQQDKSELLVCFRGPGSRKAKENGLCSSKGQ